MGHGQRKKIVYKENNRMPPLTQISYKTFDKFTLYSNRLEVSGCKYVDG